MHVIVTESNKDWPILFRQEADKIEAILKQELIAIHHIGSTSVPGLKAKPIIDIMPVVKDIEKIDSYNKEMTSLGYEALGEFGIPGRRYFRKGGSHRTHHIHIFEEENSTDIERHLAVRDYLRAHQDTADEYGELKAKLAQQFPNDSGAYSDGKDDFVKQLEETALEWKRHS